MNRLSRSGPLAIVLFASVACTVDRSGSSTRSEDAGAGEMDARAADAARDARDAETRRDAIAFDAGGPDSGCASCPLGCVEGSSRCARVAPSNVDATLFDADAPDRTLRGELNTTACGFEGASVASQVGDGPEVCVLRAGSVRVPADADVPVRGERPLVILAAGDVDIAGTLDVSAERRVPGPGGGLGGGPTSRNGRGPFPGRAGATDGTWDDGGGGGGGLCGAGGSGGLGEDARGGAGGGRLADDWRLSPLRGGSGGGHARGGESTGVDNHGYGGGGGGALQITARGTVTVGGAVLAAGGGGTGGGNEGAIENYGAGGGGGSGGAVLLEALEVRFGTSSRVVTTGGGGGGAASERDDGGDGQDGAATLDPASGGDSGGSRYGASGGDGGGGDRPDGGDGEDNPNFDANGGGGGGGAGCILIRDVDGALPGDRHPFSPRTEGGLRARVVDAE